MYGKLINYSKNKIKRLLDKIYVIKIYVIQVLLKKEIAPLAIYIEPTNICNANCIFCAYQFYDAKKEIMDTKLLNKILDEISSLNIKIVNLTPFAGEIFTDKNILSKINKIGSYKFESFSTYTNLIKLPKNDVYTLLNSGLTALHISTSPLDKDLYKQIYRSSKYDTFLENLVILLKAFSSSTNRTIKTIGIEFRSNMSHKKCLDLIDYKTHIAPLISTGITVGTMNTFDSWMGVIKKDDLLSGMNLAKPNGKKIIPCERLNNVQILSNGDMRVCGCRFNNESEDDIFKIGNINNISIFNAYNSKKVREIKTSFTKNNPPIECQKCSWYS